MSSVLTNNSAMVALETMRTTNKGLQDVQNQISTGKKVSNAKDNAAVWAISTVMSTDVQSFQQINESLGKGSSTVGVARKASEQVTSLLQDMKNLVVSAQEDLNSDDRSRIQTDIEAKRGQISNIVNAAQFNGVNLVKGTEDVDFLASLDRGADGSVSVSNITVNRQDLSSVAGKFGTAISNADSAAFATAGTGTTNSATMTATTGSTLQLDITEANANDYTVTVNGTELTYTSDADATTAEIRDNLAAQINALDIDGLTVDTGTADKLILRNTNAFESLSVQATSDTPANFVAETINGVAVDAGTENNEQSLVQRATSLNFSTTAAVEEGRGFRVTVGSDSFTYVAGKGESMEDVARGLKTAIDSADVTGLTAAVQYDADADAWSLAVDDAETGGQTITIVANDADGEASGGLFGIDKIDVTTQEGAEAALDNVETLISNSIAAAASFGSDQGRIETQSEFVTQLTDALTTGIGTLVDADMEAASARLQAIQVQQQLGVQALSIANQSPQSLLSLFR